MVPRTDFNSRNLGTGRPTIQCTACGEYSHWRRECPYDNFCTTCNNHNHATHMCRAPKQIPQQSVVICMYCGSSEHSSSQCHNRPWDNKDQPCITPEAIRDQEFQCANGEILGSKGFQSSNTQGRADQPHSHRSYSEILGSVGSYQPNNNANSQFSRGNQNHNGDQRRNTSAGFGRHSTREQQQYQPANNFSSNFRNYGYQPRGPAQSHARFYERYNQQYSPPIYPPTSSLNSSFPEALSKSNLGLLRP